MDGDQNIRKTRNTRAPSLKALENAQVDEDDINESPQGCSYVVEISESSPRLSNRRRTTNKKYDNENYETTPIKLTIRKRPDPPSASVAAREDTSTDESSDNEKNTEDDTIPKETNLFEDKLDIDGKNIFGFNTPRKRDSMLKAAMQTPKIPKTPKTPKSSLNSKTPESKRKKLLDIQSKTPRNVRSKVKKEISRFVNDNSNSDFSSGESDLYEPSSTESNESTDDENNTEVEEDDSKFNQCRNPINVPLLPKTPTIKLRQRNRKNDFVPESEFYFHSNSNKKIITSDHTLDRLKNPRLPADHLFSLLSSMKISSEHEKAIAANLKEYKTYYNKWLFLLSEGFNILCYGLGSKRQILQNFHHELLMKQNVLVINGFFPSLTLKDIFDGIMLEILEMSIVPANLHEAIDYIEEELNLTPDVHIFLIIHNLDGPMLRNAKAQEILSRLGSLQSIHLIASIDHINTPLMWDHSKLCKYNFSWWDITTMLPYTNETAFENSLMVQNSGALELSSMRNVFLSLTVNGRRIYLIIIKHQLKNKGNANYQGMPFKDLYWGCRDSFLVSSDLALRAQLTEFLDHKLVKSKRNIDGSELLTIPIESSLLQQFIDEQA